MRPHLKVACELLNGAINGTAHIARTNIETIKHTNKRKSYLKRLSEIQDEANQKYRRVLSSLMD